MEQDDLYSKAFIEKGQLETIGTYKNGEAVSKWETYNKDGTLNSEEEY